MQDPFKGVIMHIGFTGTRHGMTEYQLKVVKSKLETAKSSGFTNFHHGDCKGSDEQAAQIAVDLGYRIICHPPANKQHRAYFPTFHEIREERSYITRNHNIVDECSVILATPSSPHEQWRGSGTWATIRYARSCNKVVRVIYPNKE